MTSAFIVCTCLHSYFNTLFSCNAQTVSDAPSCDQLEDGVLLIICTWNPSFEPGLASIRLFDESGTQIERRFAEDGYVLFNSEDIMFGHAYTVTGETFSPVVVIVESESINMYNFERWQYSVISWEPCKHLNEVLCHLLNPCQL